MDEWIFLYFYHAGKINVRQWSALIERTFLDRSDTGVPYYWFNGWIPSEWPEGDTIELLTYNNMLHVLGNSFPSSKRESERVVHCASYLWKRVSNRKRLMLWDQLMGAIKQREIDVVRSIDWCTSSSWVQAMTHEAKTHECPDFKKHIWEINCNVAELPIQRHNIVVVNQRSQVIDLRTARGMTKK